MKKKAPLVVASEAQVLSAILDYLTLCKVPHARINNTGTIIKRDGKTFFGKRKNEQKGVADILGCWKGRPIAIEVKNSQGGVVTDEQRAWLLNWEKRGNGTWVIATSVDQVEKFLEGL